MTTSLGQMLASALPELEVVEGYPLSKVAYMKTGGPAEVLVTVRKADQLVALIQFLRENRLEWYMIGGGSNVLIPDEGLKGVVILNKCDGFSIDWKNDSEAEVSAESGLQTALFVRKTMDQELTGAEVFLGVPGTIGGAIYNNSHYMNELISDILTTVTYLDEESKVQTDEASALDFGYDTSAFQTRHCVILSGTFKLTKADPEAIKARMLEATKKRASTQPLGEPSSGCIFKNYTKSDGSLLSAGKLIDELGLKGTRVGGAVVSDVHANFILNTGSATTSDVLELADLIEQRVLKETGTQLEREVFLLQEPSR